MHVSTGKKCQYIGNCTFAHSTEERDLWTYMKENNSEFMLQMDCSICTAVHACVMYNKCIMMSNTNLIRY